MTRKPATALLLCTLLAGAAAQAADLRITIRQALPGRGELLVALFNRDEGWPGQPGAAQPVQRVKPEAEEVSLLFTGLAEGRWAAMVLQDLNGNGRIDSNLLGLPTEPYGASNNRLPRLAPPAFADALVPVAGPATAITIELRRP